MRQVSRGAKAVVVVVVAVGAVAGGVLAFTGAFDGPPRAFCPETYDSDQTQESELDSRTEPMATAGLRPMRMFDVVQDEPNVDDAGDPGEMLGATVEQPAWEAKGNVQLVVCQYRHHVGVGVEGGTCRGYEKGGVSVPVLGARFTYKVYEAQSKKLLTSFELLGAAGKKVCPSQIWLQQGEKLRLYADADPAEVVSRLRPFVEPG
jgi:hypothetical protein